MITVKFLRIDDRLIHGQVIVGWLPSIKPDKLIVVNEKVNGDFMRQELMGISVPPDIELEFYSPEDIDVESMTEDTFILVASPEDALSCLKAGIKPDVLNVGGMHSKEGKHEIFEALHVDSIDKKYFEEISGLGFNSVFQPTPLNAPVQMGDIL